MILEFLSMVASTPTPAPAPANSGTTQVLIAALSAGGLGAIVAAVITGIFSKRKLGAEATEIITKAASGVVQNLEGELNRQVAAREAAELASEKRIAEMAAAHVAEREEWQRVLQLHVAWDAIALAKLSELGVDLPPVPPLLPARRYVDDQGYPV